MAQLHRLQLHLDNCTGQIIAHQWGDKCAKIPLPPSSPSLLLLVFHTHTHTHRPCDPQERNPTQAQRRQLRQPAPSTRSLSPERMFSMCIHCSWRFSHTHTHTQVYTGVAKQLHLHVAPTLGNIFPDKSSKILIKF